MFGTDFVVIGMSCISDRKEPQISEILRRRAHFKATTRTTIMGICDDIYACMQACVCVFVCVSATIAQFRSRERKVKTVRKTVCESKSMCVRVTTLPDQVAAGTTGL